MTNRIQTNRYSTNTSLAKKREIPFRYDEFKRSCNQTILLNKLSHVQNIEPNVSVDDIIIDFDQKTISIILIITDLIDIPAVFNFFSQTLSEFGFKNPLPNFPHPYNTSK